MELDSGYLSTIFGDDGCDMAHGGDHVSGGVPTGENGVDVEVQSVCSTDEDIQARSGEDLGDYQATIDRLGLQVERHDEVTWSVFGRDTYLIGRIDSLGGCKYSARCTQGHVPKVNKRQVRCHLELSSADSEGQLFLDLLEWLAVGTEGADGTKAHVDSAKEYKAKYARRNTPVFVCAFQVHLCACAVPCTMSLMH